MDMTTAAGRRSMLRRIWYYQLRFCACADTEGVARLLQRVLGELRSGSEVHGRAARVGELLRQDPDTSLLLVMYMLDALDLTEHGTRLPFCWLDDRGEQLADLLESMTDEDIEAAFDNEEQEHDYCEPPPPTRHRLDRIILQLAGAGPEEQLSPVERRYVDRLLTDVRYVIVSNTRTDNGVPARWSAELGWTSPLQATAFDRASQRQFRLPDDDCHWETLIPDDH